MVAAWSAATAEDVFIIKIVNVMDQMSSVYVNIVQEILIYVQRLGGAGKLNHRLFLKIKLQGAGPIVKNV